jgi:hypothetical protein
MVTTVVGRRRLRCGERHDAEGEVQAARDDDGSGVKPFDGRIVREPGGRQRRDGIAELRVMADGKGEPRGNRSVGTWSCSGVEIVGCRVYMGNRALLNATVVLGLSLLEVITEGGSCARMRGECVGQCE